MAVNIINDGDRSPRILLREPTGSTTEVLLYGGQVVSWKNQRREELLFMSSKVNYLCSLISRQLNGILV
ncbi:hypothetical protein Hdeb2414_s0079g00778761 [Helianthus debilis subsp. tardiflorus]